MKLKALLICLLPTVLAAPSLATTTTVSSADNLTDLVTKIGKANSGDIFAFGAGTFTFTAPIYVPTGVTLEGTTVSGTTNAGLPAPTSSSDISTHVVFNLAGTDSTSYGFVLNGGDSGVTITSLDVISNHGLIQMSKAGTYTSTTITQNNFEYGAGTLSDGSLVYGISGTVTNNYLLITHNYFHDSPGTVRNWSIFFAGNSHFDNNEFYNINDGGQLIDMGANDTFNNNYGTFMHRMGQETAGGSQTTNFQVNGNTFYDYVQPYNDTEGVSICIYGTNTQIENNYFDANIAPGSRWGQQSGDQTGQAPRFGYAIEASGTPGTVSGNTLVGTWAEDVSCMSTGIQVYSNSVFGWGLWGDFAGEPGPDGYGSVDASKGNSTDRNISDAPAPPANTQAGVGPNGSTTYADIPTSTGTSGGTTSTGSTSTSTGSTSTGTGTSTGSPTNSVYSQNGTSTSAFPVNGVVVTVQSDSSVTISWTSPNPGITSTQINVISTVGRQNFSPTVVQGSSTSTTISGLHSGWLIDFTVVATGSNGQTYTSKPVTAYIPGSSVAPWSGLLWGGISVLQKDPYL